jgi:endonuclease G
MARIVGGLPTLDFPECCLVGHANPNGTIDWFCTGVLVHPRVILTAGHCFLPARPVNVAALAASNISDLSTAEIVQSRRFVQHPGYAQSRREHDISVMILRQDAATRPVPLASSAEITGAREVRLTGFGNDDRNSTRGFGRKRTVEVDVLSIRRRPDDEVEADEVRFNFDADLEFVAGGNGFDSCNGDSGGPAYLTTGASRKVAGLTSRAIANSGSPCGDGGVYTRIDAQMDFIGRVANQAGIALP